MEIIQYSDKYKDQVIDFVFNIQENEFGHRSKSGRPDLRNTPEVYQKNSGNFWLAVEGNEVVGTIALKNIGDNNGDLWRFYVKKDLRRRGIGSKLFSALLDFAKNNDYKNIYLSSSVDFIGGHKFYEKNGFKKTDSWPEGFNHSIEGSFFYKLEIVDDG